MSKKLIDKVPRDATIVLDGEDALQLGVRCRDCGSKLVVYMITADKPPAWPAGAYCYKHLLERCRRSNQIPVPMPTPIFDNLKADLSLAGRRTLYFTPPEVHLK